MRLYIVNNSLFHFCRTGHYTNFYSKPSRSNDSLYCYRCSNDSLYCYRCNLKFPSILALGSDINTYQIYTKGYFNKAFPNAPYIDLSLL